MTIMKISTTTDNTVKLEVTNVSIKYYSYKDNIAYHLFEKFKELKPAKVVFEGCHDSFEYFINFLESYGARIDGNGKVDYINSTSEKINVAEFTYDENLKKIKYFIEKDKSNAIQNNYTITVNSGHDQYKMYEILLSNGYIISSKVEKDKVHISIHGKN